MIMTPVLPRIVMVLPTYLPETFGGAEQQARRLSQALSERGARVTILAPRLCGSTPAREQDGRVSIQRFRLMNAPNLGGRYFGSFALWCAYITAWLLWHRHEYDLIHVIHGRLHAFPAVWIGARLGKPVIVKPGRGGASNFDLYTVRRKRLFGPFFAKVIARDTSAWVANSREILSDLLEAGVAQEEIHTIPNGISIPTLAETTRADDGVIRFLCLGRLDPEKSVDAIIRAFAALQDISRVELHIVGDGPCRSDLEALTSKFALQSHVVFHGAVDDVTPFLRMADYYISASLSEGMSNALLEAMSFGLPIITSTASGASDLVKDGLSGRLFAPGNEPALTALFEWAIDLAPQHRQRLGEAARETVRNQCSLNSIADRHIDLYRSVMRVGS